MSAETPPQNKLMDCLSIALRIHHELAVWNNEAALALAIDAEVVLASYPWADPLFLPGFLVLLARVHLRQTESTSTDATQHFQRASILIQQAESMIDRHESDLLFEIQSLRASVAYGEHGPEAALGLVTGRQDPHALRVRMALLLKQQRIVEAISVIDGLEPHERWCDLAVTAYTLNSQVEKSQSIIAWVANLTDLSLYSQCVVRMSDAMFASAFIDHAKGVTVQPQDITSQECENLHSVVKAIYPVIQRIQVAGTPVSKLDTTALRIAFQASHLLRRHEEVTKYLQLMAKWTPIPIDVARGVVSGYIEAPADLPERLRLDHKDDLEAGILAAAIQSESFGQHREAFSKAKELLPLAVNNEAKERLSGLIQQIWQNLEGVEADECQALAESLVSHNPNLKAIFTGAVALREKDTDRAISLLDSHPSEDDLFWLQLKANALLQKEQISEALDLLHLAAKKSLDASFLNKTGDIACQSGRFELAVWCYEKLTEIQPRNISIRSNLAHIYFAILHDLEKAVDQIRALQELEPENQVHTFNLAMCLAQLFRPEESLALYDRLCANDPPMLLAVVNRARLLHGMGRSDDALASLEVFRKRFWDDPSFLLTFMTTAHAAGKDEVGHEALIALHELREEGRVNPEAFRVLPQNEGIELFKQSFVQEQERMNSLHTEMLRGRMPWVWAEQASHTAIYLGWRTRSQKIEWLGDDPTSRARFCIYSTNGFHARESERNQRTLLPLKCPQPGTRVVADLSVLITLHRLELLEAAAIYFGEILVPCGYLATVLEDSARMIENQRSQQQNAQRILDLVNRGLIIAIPDGIESSISIPIVDEHRNEGKNLYRIKDVIQPVYSAGVVSKAAYTKILSSCACPPRVDETHPPLVQFQDLKIDLATLETLASFDVLEIVSKFYRVRITSQEHREVIRRLDAIDFKDETSRWHLDLWNRLRGDARFKFVPHEVPVVMQKKSNEQGGYLPFLSCFVAQKLKVPLMADDRVCQAFTLNELVDVPDSAFGSDAFILALLATKTLDSNKAAVAIRQLMDWRYRFIVPPPTILKALADPYRDNPPGIELREVAEYVHDCMRDSGLFGGRERTDLGESMAMKCYLTWVRNIAEFNILVWADMEFTSEAAARLTEWSCREFLPSFPKVADAQMMVHGSSLTTRIFLSHALLNTIGRDKESRMSDAMKSMKGFLQLSDDEYARIVTEILRDVK